MDNLLSFTPEQALGRFAVDQETGMLPFGQPFHQSVFSIPFVQLKGHPDQNRCRDDSETDADPLVDPRHIHDDEEHKEGKQSARKNEQVLGFEALKFYTLAYSFVNRIFHHSFFKKSVKGRKSAGW